ncbi:MAG: polysaccharide biosynthesis tyrosine autokinase [Sulfurovum sp.]
MSANPVDIPEDEINFKEIFWTLNRYSSSIIFFIFIFTMAAIIYAYFQPNIYQARATIEIGIENRQTSSGNDVIAMATSSGYISPDTEIAILKSRFLVVKALESIDFRHHYYTTINMKEFELYKKSPFEVILTKGKGLSFEILPNSETDYRVKVGGADRYTGLEWKYDKIHKYSSKVTHRYFSFVLSTKPNQILKNKLYRFKILSTNSAIGSAMGRVSAYTVGKFSSIIAISYTDIVALRAKEFTNALAQAYIDQGVDKKNREASKTLSFVNSQLDKINSNLQNSELNLENFKKNSDSVSLERKAVSISNKLDNVEIDLLKVTIQLGVLESISTNIENGKNLSNISTTGLEIQSGTFSLPSLVNKLQDTTLKLNTLKVDYTDEYPDVKKVKNQIRELKNSITSMIFNMQTNLIEQKRLFEKEIKEYKEIISTMPQDEKLFGRLKRKFVVNEKIYSYLLEKQASVAISKASTVSNNRILDKALLPSSAISPKRQVIVITGFILGLIFAIGFSLLRAFLDDRIKYEHDITKNTDIPILGIIPHIQNSPDTISLHLFPKSIITESFRHLRTNLNFMLKGKDTHTIAITSTVSREGKTTICINLASIMSMANKKTIIVSVDMRKPSIHTKFRVTNDKGMSTLLANHSTLSDVIQKTDYKNLDVITSGPIPPNPTELIQSELMEKILERLKKIYDIIIIDTPPVGLVTDARMLIDLVDTTIYVMRAEYSKKAFLKNIEKISVFRDISGIGILLNDMKDNNQKYGYEYYEDIL